MKKISITEKMFLPRFTSLTTCVVRISFLLSDGISIFGYEFCSVVARGVSREFELLHIMLQIKELWPGERVNLPAGHHNVVDLQRKYEIYNLFSINKFVDYKKICHLIHILLLIAGNSWFVTAKSVFLAFEI